MSNKDYMPHLPVHTDFPHPDSEYPEITTGAPRIRVLRPSGSRSDADAERADADTLADLGKIRIHTKKGGHE